MKFLDRYTERERLTRVLKRDDRSAFVVIYGRRRLGKSALIRHVIDDDDIYFMSEIMEECVQIKNFANVVSLHIPGFNRVEYPNWEVVLTELNIKTTKRFTLCIDEFPYLVKSSLGLPSVLQKLIDSRTLKYNIIICGSSQQMMYDAALSGSSPLYGRSDALMRLTPIDFKYIAEALNVDPVQAIEEYAVWGGVPRYWELREQVDNLWQALKEYVFTVHGDLYEEPSHLLMDDMRDIVQASTILSVIGNGVNRMSEIAARCNKPATQLSGPLDKLRTLNLIRREVPFGETEKNSKKSIYKISDPYMDFYYHFVVPHRSLIELGRTEMVMNIVKQKFNQYVSMHWEQICRDAVSGREIDGVCYGVASRWWGAVSKGEMVEIDVIAESLDGRSLLVGECKWADNVDVDRVYEDLKTKATKLPFAKGKEIKCVLFLKKGSENARRDFRVISPDDLMMFGE
ncbi:MAG: ATP-binding protein [Bacteroidia bacterium]|nr:ATP-binding protein [Bacteroidia bacterium]